MNLAMLSYFYEIDLSGIPNLVLTILYTNRELT